MFYFFGGGGGGGVLGRPRAGSENDILLPMIMTRDRPKFWNGSAWRSKVIIRKPNPECLIIETNLVEKEKKETRKKPERL